MAIIYRRRDWFDFLLLTFFNIFLAPFHIWIIIKKEPFLNRNYNPKKDTKKILQETSSTPEIKNEIVLNKYNAEKIVNDYGEVLSLENKIARRISLLKNDKEVIRKAMFLYLDSIFAEDLQTDNIINALVTSYSFIDTFIEDSQADLINKISSEIKNNQIDIYDEKNKDLKIIYDNYMKNFTSGNSHKEIITYIEQLKSKYRN